MVGAASDEVGSNGVGNPSARPPVAVVVTHFNPRLGQRVEWQHPRDFVTEGVEFKVQPNPPSAHPLRARVRSCAARMPPDSQWPAHAPAAAGHPLTAMYCL